MSNTPIRTANRLAAELKRFQPILQSARTRDVNESDTVIIVTDMLSGMFGFDKYSEITSEVSIRGTYCDLATTVAGEVQFLIEVKAIGAELKDSHTRQAVEYASSSGVDWVVLTNGDEWKIYKVNFGRPVEPELIGEFCVLSMDPKSEEHIDSLYLLSKEGFRKSALREYDAQREALSRFCIAAVLLSDSLLNAVRKELKRISPDVRITTEQVRMVLEREVIKRDVLDGDKAAEAHRRVSRAVAKAARAKNNASLDDVHVVSATASSEPLRNGPQGEATAAKA